MVKGRETLSNKHWRRVFSTVDRISANFNTQAYLWGGWVPDIYAGRQLRKHDDFDYLVIDLYKFRKELAEKFAAAGWQTAVVSNGDLTATKDVAKIHFGHVEIKGQKATWFHNGEKGQIVFPKNWLNNKTILYQGINVHAVKPEFQYVLKLHSEFMNPAWRRRPKDEKDLSQLKKLLEDRGLDLKKIEGEMKSVC